MDASAHTLSKRYLPTYWVAKPVCPWPCDLMQRLHAQGQMDLAVQYMGSTTLWYTACKHFHVPQQGSLGLLDSAMRTWYISSLLGAFLCLPYPSPKNGALIPHSHTQNLESMIVSKADWLPNSLKLLIVVANLWIMQIHTRYKIFSFMLHSKMIPPHMHLLPWAYSLLEMHTSMIFLFCPNTTIYLMDLTATPPSHLDNWSSTYNLCLHCCVVISYFAYSL